MNKLGSVGAQALGAVRVSQTWLYQAKVTEVDSTTHAILAVAKGPDGFLTELFGMDTGVTVRHLAIPLQDGDQATLVEGDQILVVVNEVADGQRGRSLLVNYIRTASAADRSTPPAHRSVTSPVPSANGRAAAVRQREPRQILTMDQDTTHKDALASQVVRDEFLRIVRKKIGSNALAASVLGVADITVHRAYTSRVRWALLMRLARHLRDMGLPARLMKMYVNSLTTAVPESVPESAPQSADV